MALAAILFGTIPAIAQQAPAVSAPNAKLEFDAGALGLPGLSFMGRAAGTFTVPIGERFGLQADLSASTAPGFTTSGAIHVFTRDPARYLIGGTFGFVRSPGATVLAAGPEAELYLDRWTVAAWGGVAAARPSSAATRVSPFIMTNAAYYVTDNWRLNLGVSWLDGYAAVQGGSEYLLSDLSRPVALTAELRVGQDGAARATLGLRGYFGPDPNKPLIQRHREDDPTDRGSALYAATGGLTLSLATQAIGESTQTEDEPPSEECPPGNPGPIGFGCL